MVCAPVRSIIPSLKLGDYLFVQAHKPYSISHISTMLTFRTYSHLNCFYLHVGYHLWIKYIFFKPKSLFGVFADLPLFYVHKLNVDITNVCEFRRAIGGLTTSNHRLEIETGRHTNKPRVECKCKLWKSFIEDEYHFLVSIISGLMRNVSACFKRLWKASKSTYLWSIIRP